MNRVLAGAMLVSLAIHAAMLGIPGRHSASLPLKVRIVDNETSDVNEMLPDIQILGFERHIRNVDSKNEKKDDPNAENTEPAKVKGFNRDNYFRYEDMVLRKIQENRKYPYAAKKRGIEGTVRIVFTIMKDGSLKSVDIVRGSGADILDDEAIGNIRRSAPFPPIPDTISSNEIVKTVNIVYRLN